MTTPVLGVRRLNRATLARQLLLERSTMDPVAALEHLLGLQSQTAQSWYTALWSRLDRFDAAAFGAQLENRSVVRIAAMRGTVHALSARDAIELRPLVQPVIERGTVGSHGRRWAGLDVAAVTEAARRILEAAPLTWADLGARLRGGWPDFDADALAQVARCYLPLVQTPPRGVWGKSGLAKHTTLEAWLGESVASQPSLAAMALRYFAAFGPATVMDLQAWCGLTRLGEVIDALRPRLRVFRSDSGRELFDLPDAPLPPDDAPAPPRFLPDYDNVLLSFADRTRLGAYDLFGLSGSANGVLPGWVLVDGFLRATWRIERPGAARVADSGAPAVLTVTALDRLSRAERTAVEREGSALARFVAGDSAPHQVRLVQAG
ncbi:MAG TPA: hypothetical protein DCP11_08390 [Microbacteriaceae bacterium]|jgi:hypothetical protein|nr:hypothetical protein [Microbacteriaceae bacterium]